MEPGELVGSGAAAERGPQIAQAGPLVTNIGVAGTRRRARLGLLALGAALLAGVALRLSGAPAWWVLGLAPLYWGAGLGLFQAKEKT
ncbi:MAG TPA: hypothetical protein VD793_07475 [Gemmatimonadales bacterium]|nr:hypothetical protein [Gemmatimonadales bacterium]